MCLPWLQFWEADILVGSVFGDVMMHYNPWLGLGLSLLFHPLWHQGLTVGEVYSLYVDVSACWSFLEIKFGFFKLAPQNMASFIRVLFSPDLKVRGWLVLVNDGHVITSL